ncbi:metallophosphoesterase family protein [Asticcacaulis tiandongensis]|uniref:metallophosphoesterase family protein n=1 Tax=Asticcacaulis tiandongensis TaxID=2565365 RepID=UPI001129FA1E|nr:metallophosphoesterase family protein [Asticcacaulis tiandongensis]
MLNRVQTLLNFLRGGELAEQAVPVSSIDMPTYAVGDVHGRFDLFEQMIARLWADAMKLKTPSRLVLLGDYVDRGPESQDVLALICALQDTVAFREIWPEIIVLRGNHEATLLGFLEDASVGPVWVAHGGHSTLVSYGIHPPVNRTDSEAWEEVRLAFRDVFPARHLELLQSSRLTYQAGDYLFVHAGIRPGQALELQNEDTFLWIRNAFLKAERAGEHVVVHGHTPAEEVHNGAWRIGLDTGAYATGVLSAVYLNETERRVVQIGTDVAGS